VSPIYDMGMYFDGKCCVCREWIKCDDPTWSRAEPAEGVEHTIAHARCVEEAAPYLARLTNASG
jgi:hypothetical protein